MKSLSIRTLVLSAAALSLWGADSDFNGRWNIHVQTSRNRAWWLEVSGAGTPSLGGRFVGAPGGQVDTIEQIRIADGALEFVFEREGGARRVKQVYRATYSAGELQGTMVQSLGAEAAEPLSWRGVRAPVIQDKDDGSWIPGRPVMLFDGGDTSNWRLLVEGRPGWKLNGDLLANEKGASDLVSNAKFWNFILRAEYRYASGSNSGIALRGRYEIQIIDDFGKPPSLHGQGALYSRVPPAQNASKAPGQWQNMEIRFVGRDLTVTLNGVKVLDKVQVDGPTAMVMDPDEDKPGPIVLQGDHGLIEFRSIVLTPLRPR